MTRLLADIASGHSALGDVLFLVAAVCAGLAALPVAMSRTEPVVGWSATLVAAAVALVAVGLLVQ